jgi:hypothetical protein
VLLAMSLLAAALLSASAGEFAKGIVRNPSPPVRCHCPPALRVRCGMQDAGCLGCGLRARSSYAAPEAHTA